MSTRFLQLSCIAFTLVVMLLPVGPVHAAQMFSSDAVAMSQTNWSTSFQYVKFDPSLGTLQSVDFQLTGYVQGTAKIENLESFPTTIDTYLQTTIVLCDSAGIPMFSAYPSAQSSTSLPAYDGTTDYAGPSGRTHTDYWDSNIQMGSLLSTHDDLSAFIGTGNGSLPVYTMESSYTLGGQRSEQLTTFASATLGVTYTYVPVPEPMTMGLLAAGAVVLLKRRNR